MPNAVVASGLWQFLALQLTSCAGGGVWTSKVTGNFVPGRESNEPRSASADHAPVLTLETFLRRVVRKTGLVGLLISVVFGHCSYARAASPDDWQRLPDGRVVIQLKDVRVALPAAGPDTELITFYDRNQIRHKMNLKEVIANPSAARRLFQNANLIFVSLPNLIDRPGLYLGKFPRLEFKSVGAGFAVGQGALAACQDWTQTVSRLSNSLMRDSRTLSPDGWAEFKLRERPITLAYVRSPRESNKPFFPGLSCDYFKDCGSTKCLTLDLAASYGFSSRKIGQPNWLSLDEKMRRLLAYIFIDLKIEGGTK